MVKSVTMDMSNSMYKIVRKCFPNAQQIVDRFHVQKLMYDALQDLRIKHRWEVMAEDNRMRALYKEKGLEGDRLRRTRLHHLTRYLGLSPTWRCEISASGTETLALT